jgi:hypothetical protein
VFLPPAVQVGRLLKVSCKADMQKAEAVAKDDGFLLMDASDWKVRGPPTMCLAKACGHSLLPC